MSPKVLTLIVALSVAVSAATLIDRATATGTYPGCCICFCGAQNATSMGRGSSETVCSDVANMRECDTTCTELGCGGAQDFAGNTTCSDPALAETCGTATMAPASSPIGLMALVAALSGFGAYYLRRRSMRG